MPVTFESAVPVELTPQQGVSGEPQGPPSRIDGQGREVSDKDIVQYVVTWRNQLKQARWEKRNIWDECWQLYRGVENWSDKQDWQSKIALPKAFSSVKQATNSIKRLLQAAKKPYQIESVNPEDLVTTLRGGADY